MPSLSDHLNREAWWIFFFLFALSAAFKAVVAVSSQGVSAKLAWKLAE